MTNKITTDNEVQDQHIYIEKSPIAIIVSNLKGKCIYANKSACEMLHYSKDELISSSISKVLPIKPSSALKSFKVLMKNKKYSEESKIVRKDGEVIDVKIDGMLLPDNEIIAYIRDITREKKAEEKLKNSEEKFRVVVTNSQPIIFIIDLDGNFILSEGRSLSTLGLKPGQVVGQSAFEMYEDYPEIIEGIKESQKGKILSKIIDFQSIIFDIFYSPYKNLKGEIIGTIGMAVDITERENTEKKLKENVTELESKNSEIEKINKFLIGRETKMVELKKKISELEKKLSDQP